MLRPRGRGGHSLYDLRRGPQGKAAEIRKGLDGWTLCGIIARYRQVYPTTLVRIAGTSPMTLRTETAAIPKHHFSIGDKLQNASNAFRGFGRDTVFPHRIDDLGAERAGTGAGLVRPLKMKSQVTT